ncbi:MAG TPA: hypothetical protein VK963_00635, partial [Candidatus Saccharimonadales bacterium]|nr:hypothetical protein [Candidatus Saccharimonadales bacterium]
DKTTAFNVRYFYRVKAIDNAGNVSPDASVDISTGSFNSNVSSQSGSVVTSEDGAVSVDIPQGSVSKDAVCSVVTDDLNKQQISAPALQLVTGPYALVCKLANGDAISSFQIPVTVTIKPSSDQLKQYDKFQVHQFDPNASSWAAADGEFNKQAKTYGLSLDKPAQIALLGVTKKSYVGLVLSILVPLVLLVGGVFFYRLRQMQRQQYNDYLRRKYYNL